MKRTHDKWGKVHVFRSYVRGVKHRRKEKR